MLYATQMPMPFWPLVAYSMPPHQTHHTRSVTTLSTSQLRRFGYKFLAQLTSTPSHIDFCFFFRWKICPPYEALSFSGHVKKSRSTLYFELKFCYSRTNPAVIANRIQREREREKYGRFTVRVEAACSGRMHRHGLCLGYLRR